MFDQRTSWLWQNCDKAITTVNHQDTVPTSEACSLQPLLFPLGSNNGKLWPKSDLRPQMEEWWTVIPYVNWHDLWWCLTTKTSLVFSLAIHSGRQKMEWLVPLHGIMKATEHLNFSYSVKYLYYSATNMPNCSPEGRPTTAGTMNWYTALF